MFTILTTFDQDKPCIPMSCFKNYTSVFFFWKQSNNLFNFFRLMGKQKKKNIADNVRNKRKESQRKINPFEVKINRQKHDVLGRKISKHDRGMPGLSRSKAIKKVNKLIFKTWTLFSCYAHCQLYFSSSVYPSV
jgi:hypothetical protein